MKITKRQLRRIIKEAWDDESLEWGAAGEQEILNKFWSDNEAAAKAGPERGGFLDELEYAHEHLQVEFNYDEDPEGNPWTPESMQNYAAEVQSNLVRGEYYGK